MQCFQDFNSFARYISQFRSAEFYDAVADFHVLVFLAALDIVPLRFVLFEYYRQEFKIDEKSL